MFSVDSRRPALHDLLSQIAIKLDAVKLQFPELQAKGPLVFDSSTYCDFLNQLLILRSYCLEHLFDSPVNAQNNRTNGHVHRCCMHRHYGYQSQHGKYDPWITINLRYAFMYLSGTCNPREEAIVNQVPATIETVLSKFNLEGKKTVLAACPDCHFTYYPSFQADSATPSYPTTCSHHPYPDAEVCGAQSIEIICTNGITTTCPLVPYHVYDFHDYLASLVSRKHIKTLADERCDNLMATVNAGTPPPSYVTDAFEVEFIRQSEGTEAGKLFVDRPGTEGHYLFAFNVDFFNSEGMRTRGARTSSGIIAAACLNLPLDIHYKPENMYLASVIPGPKEPRLTELNHYLKPV